MPDKKSPDSTNSDAGGGGSKRLIIMGALCVVICGAGFVLGGRMAGGGTTEAAAAEAAAEAEAEKEPTITDIVELEPLNVNLADGHYLRIAVAIGIEHHEDEAADAGGHGATDEDEGPPIKTAPASDLVLSTFSGREMSDLSTAAGRERARTDLYDGLAAYYGEQIVTVLFTEFVMQ